MTTKQRKSRAKKNKANLTIGVTPVSETLRVLVFSTERDGMMTQTRMTFDRDSILGFAGCIEEMHEAEASQGCELATTDEEDRGVRGLVRIFRLDVRGEGEDDTREQYMLSFTLHSTTDSLQSAMTVYVMDRAGLDGFRDALVKCADEMPKGNENAEVQC